LALSARRVAVQQDRRDRRARAESADRAVNAGQSDHAARRARKAPRLRKLIAPHFLAEVNGHIEDIYKELDVQMKRMSQIQQQVDELREKIRKLSE
jgi:hypothetical protein